MAPEMAKELRALQKENARLKKMVADQALDMEILKEAAKGNWPRPSIKGPSGGDVRSTRSVASWGRQGFLNDELVVCWASHERLSVINLVSQPMKPSCLLR